MTLPVAPTEPEKLLRWLADRAAISDLIVEYARSADARDWDAFRSIWVEDAHFEVPGFALDGRDAIVAAASGPQGLPDWEATHHMTANHQIHVDGDTATAIAYITAIHVRDASQPQEHGDGGGWYSCEFRREPEGWRYASSVLTVVWIVGTDLPGGPKDGVDA